MAAFLFFATNKIERFMSKKQKRRAASTSRKPAQLSPDALANQARQDLEAGRFRDAIAGFKQLLKLEARADWRAALAEAYAGRARELTAKGMTKEAMVMWDNRAALGPDVPASADHLALLLQSGRIETALDRLASPGEVPAAELERLRSVLAARALTAGAAITDRLPPEDPIRRQASAASAALDAYCAGDAATLRASLGEIPFRSPYRDLAQILKALQLLPDNADEASKALSRVGADSGFAPLKAAAELALLPESEFLDEALAKSGPRVRLACVLRGWPDARIALLDELRRLGPDPKPSALLGFLHQHRSALGESWARRKSLHLLAPQYPASLSWLDAVGARPAAPLEQALVAAWHAERIESVWEITHTWAEVAEALKDGIHDPAIQRNDTLRIALAQRRADRVTDILSSEPSPTGAPDDVQRATAERVEESLKWDPEDRDTYLRLIAFYRGHQQPKEARRLLAAATERWPDDMRILQATMQTALDSGAFKKASSLARRILAIDPINSGVRDALVEAHMAHARKQLLKRRPDLAGKELEAAREWARSEHAKDQLDILAGLTALDRDGDPGVDRLRAVAERLGRGLTARVLIAQAANAAGQTAAKLLKTLGLDKVVVPKADDLLAALGRMRRLLDSGAGFPARLHDILDKAFSKARWTDLQRSDVESACETLKRAGLSKTREKAARAALKRWRGAPIFQLHLFEAKYPNGGYSTFGNKDVWELEIALDQARTEGDTRTAMRIESALQAGLGSPFRRGPSPFDLPPYGFDDEFEPEDETPFDYFMDLIEEHGLEKAMDVLNVPRDLRSQFREMARSFGEGGLVDILEAFVEEMVGLGPDALPPPPSNRGKPKPKPKTGKKPDDDDPSAQLDLFS